MSKNLTVFDNYTAVLQAQAELYQRIINRSLQAQIDSVVISSGTVPSVDVLTPAGDPTFRVLSFVEGDNRAVAMDLDIDPLPGQVSVTTVDRDQNVVVGKSAENMLVFEPSEEPKKIQWREFL